MILPIEWLYDRVKILDQTRLPHEEVYLETADYHDVADAICELKVFALILSISRVGLKK